MPAFSRAILVAASISIPSGAFAAVPGVLASKDSPTALEVIPVRDASTLIRTEQAAKENQKLAAELVTSAKTAQAEARASVDIAEATIDAKESELALAKKQDDEQAMKRLSGEIRITKAKRVVLEHILTMRESEIEWAEQEVKVFELEAQLAADERDLVEDRERLNALFEKRLDPGVTKRIMKLEEKLWQSRSSLLERAESHAKALERSAKKRRALIKDRRDILKEQRDLMDAEEQYAY